MGACDLPLVAKSMAISGKYNAVLAIGIVVSPDRIAHLCMGSGLNWHGIRSQLLSSPCVVTVSAVVWGTFLLALVHHPFEQVISLLPVSSPLLAAFLRT